ncbi:MAG: hypothetical protein LC793_24065, partial [Thermomicrobia bacterium]|nr:hypothetical protein [Thermomicrobia bacterium]
EYEVQAFYLHTFSVIAHKETDDNVEAHNIAEDISRLANIPTCVRHNKHKTILYRFVDGKRVDAWGK